MKYFSTLMLITFIATSCGSNYEEEGSDGLFAGHNQVDDSFTLVVPDTKTYLENQNIDIKLVHPYKVTVSGTPRIPLTIGSSSVYANYISGTGTKSLKFRYTVTSGDLDLDGIQQGSDIDLNGGSLSFNDGVTNQNTTTKIPDEDISGVYVDAVVPTVSISAASILPKTYLNGKVMQVVAIFSEYVDVTGTPQVELDIGGTTTHANYVTGSGGTTLIFQYTITDTDLDADGVEIVSFNLNGGSIKDKPGNSADLSFSSPTLTAALVDGDSPYVVSYNMPSNGTYSPGEQLTFDLLFSEVVDVSGGTPEIGIDVGGTTKTASYSAGTGTNTLSFTYSITTGDVDLDGITIQNAINFNGSTIQDSGTTNALGTMSPPLTPDILVDGTLPKVESIIAPSDNTYLEGQELYFNLQYNVAVDVTGLPRFPIILNSHDPTPVYAEYSSGSGTNTLIFRYVVSATEEDLDGLTIDSPIDVNGGSIIGYNGVTADHTFTTAIASTDTTNILVDAKSPQIISINPPPQVNYITGENIDFIFDFHEIVTVTGTPRLTLDVGGSTVYANYESGTGTSSLTFRYTVSSGDFDDNGIAFQNTLIDLNSGTIIDQNNLNASLDFTSLPADISSVKINYEPPLITSITPPLDQWYTEGDTLGFTINTNVNIDITSGTPRLELDVGGQQVYADYVSGTGTSALYFAIVLPASLEDHNGIEIISPLDTNGSNLKDAVGNNLDLTFTAPDTSGVFVDTLVPYVVNITPPSDQTYILNEDLDFILNYNENVDVTNTPRFSIDIGGTSRFVEYVSGTGTNALTFRYTTQAPDEDLDGISFSGSTIDINGGSITDVGSNDSNINLNAFSALPNVSGILVDAVIPSITSITPPADKTYIYGEDLDFIVNFDDNVDITNTPQLEITLNSQTVLADYISGTGTNALTFRYTVDLNHEDTNGLELVSPLTISSATIQDTNGNDAEVTFTAPATTGVLVDGVLPTVSIDSSPTIDASNVTAYPMSGTCSEDGQAVNVDIGGVTDSATCSTGTWSTSTDVSAATESADNTVADVAITADHQDAAGNDAVQATATVIKDSIAPTISSNSIAANTYIIGDTIDLVLNFSEDITSAGSETVDLTIGASTVAMAQTATTANSVTYSYTVVENDLDTDGLGNAASITLGAGAIEDNVGNALTNSIPTTNHVTSLVDGVKPTITNVAVAANTYYIGDNLDVTVTFDENIDISNSPEIPLSFETMTATPTAVYDAGTGSTTITFRYVAVDGNEDTNGLDLAASISLAGGAIKDVNGNDAYLSLSSTNFPSAIVDAILPTVTIDSSPTIDTSNVTAYPMSGTCSEDGQAVNVDIGGVTDSATCSTGTWSTSTDVSAATESADNTVADVAITADHQDAGANDAIQATATVIKDTIAPTISSNSIAANTYIIGDTIDLVLNFSEDITSAGSETVDLTIGASTVAMAQTATTANSVTYSYTVVENDLDTDGLDNAASISIGGGSIVDAVGNDLTNSIPTTNHVTSLVDGVKPTITNVAVAANTYYIGDNLDVTLTFDEDVDITSSPEIPLTFETMSATPTAVYNSGTGSTSITFRYVPVDGNEDTNGLDLAASISLAGGAVKDVNGNDAYLSLSSTNFPTAIVDAILPTVTIDATDIITATNVTSFPLSGTCSEDGMAVNLDIGGVTDSATCSTGTWSTTTDVSAAAESTDNTVADVAITADHQDGGGNSAIQATDTQIKDTILPTIDSNSIAANTYIIGDTIDLVLNFSEDITSAGSETVDLTIGASTVAMAQTATTANSVTYSYTVVENDLDTDGLDNAASISIGGGSIVDAVGNDLTNSIPTTNHVTSLVDGVKPTITNVAVTANTYVISDTINIDITYDDNVTLSGLDSRIPLTFETQNTGTINATYDSGNGTNTLRYVYTVAVGDEDTNGIDLATNIDLNTNTIVDANGNSAYTALSSTNFPSVLVDAIIPTVAISSAPTIDASNVTSYPMSGTCSDDGQTVNVNIGGVTDSATCSTGTWSTSTDVSAATESADNTVADVAITADHQDAAGNDAVQATDTVIKDTILPTIDSNSIAANTYIIGDTIDLVLNFSEDITSAGSETVDLTIGASTVAMAQTATTANSVTYSYTVVENDLDTDGVSNAASITIGAGGIEDNVGNAITNSIPTTNHVTSLVDGVKPTITAVNITANTYVISDTINIDITYDDNVTLSGPNSRIPLTFETQNTGTINATYDSGNGTNTLRYVYTVAVGDEDTNGIDLATNIDLNTNTIVDANGNSAYTALSSTNFPSVLVDAIIPTVAISSAPTIDASNVTSYPMSGTCSDNGQTVNVNIGGVTDSATCSTGTWSTSTDVSAATESADNTVADVAITADHQDAAGNDAVQATDTVIKDTIAPTIDSNSIAANTYIIGDTIDLVLNFSEDITSAGSETVDLTIGASTVAMAQTATTANSITYSYTVVENDLDTDGLGNAASISIGGGSIVDAVGNDLTNSIPTTNHVTSLVDGVKPTITAVNITANTYVISDTINIDITYDDNVTLSGPNSRIPLTFETQNTGTINATYDSGNGTNTLRYSYTIPIGDEDTNGIDLTANIDLNTNTLVDDNGNSAYTALSSTNFPTVLVDAIIPTVAISSAPTIDASNVTAYPMSGTCSDNGQTVNVDIGGVTDSATCSTGTWSTTTDVSAAAESTNNTVADLSITADHQDAAGNDAIQATDTVIKDTILPTIDSNSIAANTYIIGDTIDLVLNFSEDITSAGSETVDLTIGASTVSMAQTATTANSITYSYTVVENDLDTDGLSNAASITLGAGAIEDNVGNALTNSIPTTNHVTSLVDGVKPTITAVNITANTYVISDTINIDITYDDNVTLSGPNSRIPLTFETQNTGTINATYDSGNGTNTLRYVYTVAVGDEDTNGIDLNANIDLNTNTIVDANGNSAYTALSSTNFPSVLVDAIIPTVAISSAPTIDASNVTSYPMSGTCSDDGQTVNVNIGGVTDSATCSTGTWSTSTDVSAATESADNTVADVAITADHQDAAGNDAVQATATVIKDSIAPTISSNSIAANTYIIGDTIDLVLNFSEDITSAGSETVDLTIGASTVSMNQTATTANTITYSYTVVEDDLDTDGVSNAASITIGAGGIEDNVGNAITNSIPTTNYATVIVDGVKPTITNVAITADTYGTDDIINIDVTFNEDVNFSGVNSRIPLTFETQNTGSIYAGYESGSGTDSIRYSYTVTTGDEDTNGIDLNANIDLNTNTLVDANGNSAYTTLSSTNFPSVLVDAIVPLIAISSPSNFSYINISSDSTMFSISGTCDVPGETVTIKVDGTNASSPSGFLCDGASFSGTIDSTGLSEGLRTFTAEITDAGNNTGTSANVNITKDTIAPTITLDSIADVSLSNKTNYTITGTCSENGIAVDLSFGSLTDSSINCSSGTFSKTGWDVSSEADNVNVAVTADILDDAGNPAIQATTNITKDTVAPIIAITSPADGDYINSTDDSNTYAISGTCDESSASVTIKIDGTAASGQSSITCDGTNFSGTIDTTGYADATYSLTAEVSDSVGNIGSSNSNNIIKDTVAPSVAITTPLNNDYINISSDNSNYTISGTCNESSQVIDIKVDGVSASSQSGFNCDGSNFTGTIDSTAIAESTFSLTAYLVDSSGNDTTSSALSLTRDVTAPTVAITTANDVNTSNVNSYTLSGTCNEDTATVNISFGALSNSATCSSSSWSVSAWDVSAEADNASVTITADLTDAAGNDATQATTTVVKDVSAPSVAITTPADSTYINSSTDNASFAIAGTCDDASASYTLKIDGSATGSASCDGSSLSGSFNSTTLTEAAHTIVVEATDSVGNTTTSASNSVTRDVTAPTVAITTANDVNTSNVNSYTLSGTCNEDTATVNISFGALSNSATCSSSSWSVSAWDVSAEADNASVTITADLTDAAGNDATQATTTVVKDVSAPSVAITTPADSTYINSSTDNASFAIAGTCDDASASYTLKIDGSATGSASCDGSSLSGSFNSTTLTEAAHTIVVEATDSVGNTTTSASNSVTRDVTAPTVAITTANDVNTSNVNSYTLSGTCNEDTATVNISFGALSNSATCSSSSWSVSAWDVSAEADNASVTITADLTDAAGNDATQASTTVVKDVSAPSVAITTPADSTYINSSTDNASFAIAGTCDDASASYTLKIDGSATGSASCDGSSLSGSFNSTTLTEAAHTIVVEATDSVGNTTTSASNSVTRDVTAPTVAITTANDVNTANVSSYTLSGTCNEDTATVNISFGALSNSATCSSSSWSVSAWDVSAEADNASVTITADLTDAAGNDATQASTTVVKDVSAPSVAITTPADSTYINSSTDNASFAIAGTCDDASASYTLKIDGSATGSASCDGSSLSGSFNSTTLTEAAHTIVVEATDSVGNTTTSASNSVTRDVTAPTVAITTANDVNTSNVNSYTLSGTCNEDTATVNISFGALSNSATCSSSSWSVSAWDVSAEADNASITITADLTDAAGNDATQATTTVVKDTNAPNISSVISNASGNYNTGGTLSFTVNYDEAVDVAAGTRLNLTINDGGSAITRYATCNSTSSSTSTTCTYTVQAADLDTNGMVVNSPYELNTGSVTDINGNSISGLSFSSPNTTSVTINMSRPEFQYENESTTIVSSHSFPDADEFTTENHVFTVTNTGSETTTTNFAITKGVGVSCDQFSIGTDNCSGNTIGVSGTCTVEVTFTGLNGSSSTYSCDITADDTGYTSNPGFTLTVEGTSIP